MGTFSPKLLFVAAPGVMYCGTYHHSMGPGYFLEMTQTIWATEGTIRLLHMRHYHSRI